MKVFRFTCIALGVMLLSGCSMFSPVKADPENNYRLDTLPCVSKKATHYSTLLVTQPETSPIYNTRQMVYSNKPYQIGYFAKNHWAEPPAKMLEQLMVQSIQNTHYYHAVITPPFVGKFDYVLSTQLVEFRQDYTVNPSVMRISLRAQLTQASTNRIIAAKQFSVTQATPENTPYGGVIASNYAVSRLLKQVTQFALR